METLKKWRRIMGTAPFWAQVRQQPVPGGGVLVKRKWLGVYETAPEKQPGDVIAQCWDTASAETDANDFSACVTALIRKREVYVLDVFRGRLGFPALVRKVQNHAKQWKADALLIEKAASGIELMQVLETLPDREVPTAIPRPTATSKESRMWGQLARFEAGDVRLPADAPWLGTFLHELLGFPKTRHDDQADALVHLLIWSLDAGWDTPINSGPMIHNPETGRWEGGDFGDRYQNSPSKGLMDLGSRN